MLIYPDKIISSVLFEAGLAVALGKPSVYFIRDRSSLPFLKKKAEQAELPAGVRIYEYESLAKIETLLQNPGKVYGSIWGTSLNAGRPLPITSGEKCQQRH